jgi:endonuclease/exonuclease/phosphatase family metal-dependent hydrolase
MASTDTFGQPGTPAVLPAKVPNLGGQEMAGRLPTTEFLMRIGTWNVEYGFGTRNPDRLNLLTAQAADIWVLTETHQTLDLSPTHSPVTSEPRRLRREGSTWATIWSKFKPLRLLPVPDPRRMVAAIFDFPGGPVTVAGVVLPWHSDRGDEPADPPPRNWQEHRRVLRDQMPTLLRSLRLESADARRVIAGDFNTSMAPPHCYGLAAERQALAQLLAEEGLVCHTATVLYPPPSIPRTLIDHVCTNLGPAEAVETWTGVDGKRPRLSDHPGVVVTFPS